MDMKDKQNPNRIRVKRFTDDQEPTEIIRTIFAQKRSFERKKAKLVVALLSCRGLQHIIDVGYEVLGNPMFVSDMGYNVLAFNQNAEVGDPSWPTAEHEAEFETYERIKKLNDSGVFERLYTSPVPCIEHFDYSPTLWMAHKIAINEKNIGHIAVVESKKAFDDMDFKLLQLLCSMVASELQKEPIQSSHFNNEFEHFLIDLLEEKITKIETIHKQVKKLCLDTKKYLFIVTISPELKGKNGMSLSYLKGIINRLLGTEKSILYQNKVTTLILSDKKEGFSSTSENKLIEFLKSNGMNGGISNCFQDLVGLRKHYDQSIKALALGLTIAPKKKLFYYQEYSCYHLLELASEQTNLKEFCSPLLLDLIEYDWQYKTNYGHNLYIHLQNDCNVTKTAQHFEIHRNSMKYRIKKIEEIMGATLDEIETKFSLFQSFKILTFIGEEFFK